MNTMSTPRLPLLAIWTAVFFAPAAQAMDFNVSGFGTVGFAQSDKAYHYQRFIDEEGTFTRDSIIGVQGDFKFTPQWGATIQGKFAPSTESDRRWDATLSWAFVSWRPSDEWLVRAGKLRLPFMLNTENADVGATYDLARLPMEVYSIAPTTDVVGLSISKTWLGDMFDFTLEGYTGKTQTHWRYYGREFRESEQASGSLYLPIKMQSSGLVISARTADHIFRAGFHEIEVTRTDGGKTKAEIIKSTPIPGVDIYDFAPGGVDKMLIPVYNVGLSLLLPADLRVTSEYARMRIATASQGLSRWGAYLAVSRRFGEWTPYAYFSKVKSAEAALDLWRRIDGNVLPQGPFERLNFWQKFIADIIVPMDQSTLALGSSWRLTNNAVMKAEWAHVRTGVGPGFIDARKGSNGSEQHLNVYSLSYSFIF